MVYPVKGNEGEIKDHELFEFEAYINHNEIIDGTEPFDKVDTAGNDSSQNNGIVCSWDDVTYPLKQSIKEKKS
ncbi:hypothetical protein AN965_11670 [Alkalicoccobacillus plakortidis]|uniref:Uncharacterized protein n=1 Tax=Alkalicoccobacillus plakortidis TaxID=444060 RepID=A0A9D5DQR9_9BACI|nr:hypothetical protein [Alkalicoccobacillus plakortidis]KQL56895.1 hypothetical protein AN965_11670 [Alkalicoccobacillus plakortidis]